LLTRLCSFCDVTLQGDVASLEQAAQAAYNALLFGLSTTPTNACRLLLHDWVCWQFFTKCAADLKLLRPVCRSTCQSFKDSCLVGWLDCEVEVEEERHTAPPWWYDASGKYIRGIKPANASVPLAGLTLDNGGVLGQGPVFGDKPCTGAGSSLKPRLELLLLLGLLVLLAGAGDS